MFVQCERCFDSDAVSDNRPVSSTSLASSSEKCRIAPCSVVLEATCLACSNHNREVKQRNPCEDEELCESIQIYKQGNNENMQTALKNLPIQFIGHLLAALRSGLHLKAETS